MIWFTNKMKIYIILNIHNNTTKIDEKVFPDNNNIPKLNDISKLLCEEILSLAECTNALKNLN